MGLALAQARSWLAKRAEDLPRAERDFIDLSLKRDARERAQRERLQQRTKQMVALVGVLVLGIGAGLAWSSRAYLKARAVVLAEAVWPETLTAERERALQPKETFKECADCPVMVVVPAGEFMMGSPANEKDRSDIEGPQHKVTIVRPFTVAKLDVTFGEYDACVTLGGCAYQPSDRGWGRGTRPVINVSWHDAQQYVTWLSRRTGKPYRLLSEAEFEYAARAGSTTAYPWGDDIGKGNANCDGCGSQWDRKQTAPVGSFAANAFGLNDMQGNVFQWVEDCVNANYNGAPTDGSAWITGNCDGRVVRGGSWVNFPLILRSALRGRFTSDYQNYFLGFRVGRTLTP
jgi:formylglycine-generating enzyme required for sulfatase activity